MFLLKKRLKKESKRCFFKKNYIAKCLLGEKEGQVGLELPPAENHCFQFVLKMFALSSSLSLFLK